MVRRPLESSLTDLGNTVLVIEHDLDGIKCADRLIDMAPEGGGTVVDGGRRAEDRVSR